MASSSGEAFGNHVDRHTFDNTNYIEAVPPKSDGLATALASVEQMGQNHAQDFFVLGTKIEEMELAKTKAIEVASAKASKEKDEAVAELKATHTTSRKRKAEAA